MVRINRSAGRNRDLPQIESINLNASSAGGVSTDYEHPIVVIPNLALGAPAGASGLLPLNSMTIRSAYIAFEANVTGVATNNFTLNILQRRNGALLVNTTSATTISPGVNTVTPASMANIAVNTPLLFSGGTGAAETVMVQSVTATSFTANFANGHSGAYAITSAPLASITFNAGMNAAAFVPLQLPVLAGNTVKPGDVATIQRVSNGTGLASPALTVGLEWVNAGPG